jgi:hypothetical protein
VDAEGSRLRTAVEAQGTACAALSDIFNGMVSDTIQVGGECENPLRAGVNAEPAPLAEFGVDFQGYLGLGAIHHALPSSQGRY